MFPVLAVVFFFYILLSPSQEGTSFFFLNVLLLYHWLSLDLDPSVCLNSNRLSTKSHLPTSLLHDSELFFFFFFLAICSIVIGLLSHKGRGLVSDMPSEHIAVPLGLCLMSSVSKSPSLPLQSTVQTQL